MITAVSEVAALSVRPPVGGFARDTSTTFATQDIPASWRRQYVEVTALTADCYVLVAPSSVTSISVANSTSFQNNVPILVPAGQSRHFVWPDDGAMRLCFQAVSGTGKLLIRLS